MALGRERERQADLMGGWAEMSRWGGHLHHGRLQYVLIECRFAAFAEAACAPYVMVRQGRPSILPGIFPHASCRILASTMEANAAHA